MFDLSRLLRCLPFIRCFLPKPPAPVVPEILRVPPEGAVTYTSGQLNLDVDSVTGRFSCFHCGNVPQRGDVVMIKMRSGKDFVMIVQSMDAHDRTFEYNGLEFGMGLLVGYAEAVTFPIPPPAKIGFILG